METVSQYSAKDALREAGIAGAVAGGIAIYENGDPVPAGFFIAGGVMGRVVDYVIESHQKYGIDNLALVRGGVIFMWGAATALTSYVSMRSGLTPDIASGLAGAFVGSIQKPGREGIKTVSEGARKISKGVRRASRGVRTVYDVTRESRQNNQQ